ncbi:MAG: hypothetical protein KDD02_19145, partial [Phaeodactylibacter sp.]|nr:hypothetical protein [Phaeodactylibacter sp.]
MAALNRHIIHRQLLDIRVGPGEAGHSLQEALSRMAWEKLQPALEQLFDQYAGPEELVRVDKLEVELGRLPREGLEESFLARVLEALEEQLRQKVQRAPAFGVERLPLRQSQFQHWLVYLASGVLPWEAARAPQAEWQQQVLEALASNSQAIDQLTALLRRNERALQRLVLQHDESFLLHILETLTARKGPEWAQLSLELSRLWEQAKEWDIKPIEEKELLPTPQARAIFWKVLLKWAARHRSYPEPIAVLQQFFRQSLPQAFTDSALGHSLEGLLRRFISGQGRQYPILARLLEKHPGEGVVFGQAEAEIREPGLEKGFTPKRSSEGLAESPSLESGATRQAETAKGHQQDETGRETGLTEEKIPKNAAGLAQAKEEEETGAIRPKAPAEGGKGVEQPLPFDENSAEAGGGKPEEAETALRKKPAAKEEGEAAESSQAGREEAPAIPEARTFSEVPDGAFYAAYYAGVVILHPYQPALIRALVLVEGNA